MSVSFKALPKLQGLMGEVFIFLKSFVNFAHNTLRQANLGGRGTMLLWSVLISFSFFSRRKLHEVPNLDRALKILRGLMIV
jgi:hypothetical protein